MTILGRRFFNAEVLHATGITNDQLQNWMKRGLIISAEDVEGGGGPGRYRTFSFFNLMEVAIAKALIDAGQGDLRLVTRAAQVFAHTGNGPLPGKPARLPGLPFNVPESRTLMLSSPQRSEEYLLTKKDGALSLYAAIRSHGAGATVIDATDAFRVAMTRLDISPDFEMRAAYGEADYVP